MSTPDVAKSKRRASRPNDAAIRLTLNRISVEFDLHWQQLDRRRRALGIEPGEDGCFSLHDAKLMVLGDKEAETIGKIAAERREIEMRIACREGELIPTAVVDAMGEKFLVAVRQKILTSGMTDAEKDGVLTDLVALGEVDWKEEAQNAAKRTR